MDMKFRAKSRRKARKRSVCPANFTRQQNKMAAKDTQNIETIALSTSNKQQCTTITPNTTSDKTFKPLKNMSEEKITRSSKIYHQTDKNRALTLKKELPDLEKLLRRMKTVLKEMQ